MKKLFGEAGLKGFLAHHVEKLLFGLTMLIALFLIYRGFSNRVGIRPDYDPAKLVQKVQDAEANINRTTWNDGFKEQRETELNFKQRAENANQEIKTASFSIQQHIRPPYQPPRTMRKDPELFAAMQLQARSYFATLRKSGENDRSTADDPFGQATGPQRRGGEATLQEEEEEGVRSIPTGRGGVYSSEMSGRGGQMGEAIGEYFVAVTGLIPYRQQLKAFNDALGNSSGYDPSRDMPYYFNWKLERAEVQPGQEPQWKAIANNRKLARVADQWGGTGGRGGMSNNLVDPEATDPDFTMPLLAMEGLSDDQLDSLMRHPALPRAKPENRFRGGGERRRRERPDEGQTTGTQSDELDMFGRADRSRRAGAEGRRRSPDSARRRGPEQGGGADAFAIEPRRGREFGGERRGGFTAGQIPDPKDHPEFKMFRYVDMDVEPGNSYQYRLTLWLEDPNEPDPRSGNTPPVNTLEVAVQQRLTKLAGPTEPMKKAGITRIFWRETEPSEPSNIVKVSDGRRLIVGNVKAVDRRGLIKAGSETMAEVMALEFDAKNATDIPGKFSAYRGTIANITLDTEVPHWSEGKLRELKDHRFQVDTAVLDIEGGDELGVGDLTAPGELLVFRDGNMSIVEELQTKTIYEKFDFPPEDKLDRREGGMEMGLGREGRGGGETDIRPRGRRDRGGGEGGAEGRRR